MKIIAHEIYHIYNQGNNRETIFYSHEDYLQFLAFFRKFVFPHCSTLCYCLMPNHYHFLVYTTQDSAVMKPSGNIEVSVLSNGFRLLQSTYAKHINKHRGRTGSLFKQKAQAKSTHDGDKHYELTAFRYIHKNPLEAKLVSDLKKWPYSSCPDYADIRNGTMCDKELAFKLIELEKEKFVEESYKEIDPNEVAKLFLSNR